MRTIEINIYTINELANEAIDKAYNNWLINSDYMFHDENKNTLYEFEKIFPIEIGYWEYGYNNYIDFEFSYDSENEIENLSGIRLMKYITNNYHSDIFKGKCYSLFSKTETSENNPNLGKLKSRHSKVIFENCCPLTGYYMDYEILDPIYDFLKKPSENTTFYNLMEECLNSWIKACTEDYKYCTSMGYFIELSKENKWEYTKDGELI